jgi:hypothetical protein
MLADLARQRQQRQRPFQRQTEAGVQPLGRLARGGFGCASVASPRWT